MDHLKSQHDDARIACKVARNRVIEDSGKEEERISRCVRIHHEEENDLEDVADEDGAFDLLVHALVA